MVPLCFLHNTHSELSPQSPNIASCCGGRFHSLLSSFFSIQCCLSFDQGPPTWLQQHPSLWYTVVPNAPPMPLPTNGPLLYSLKQLPRVRRNTLNFLPGLQGSPNSITLTSPQKEPIYFFPNTLLIPISVLCPYGPHPLPLGVPALHHLHKFYAQLSKHSLIPTSPMKSLVSLQSSELLELCYVCTRYNYDHYLAV